jgi:hypothetical protein
VGAGSEGNESDGEGGTKGGNRLAMGHSR